jgi:hypothetical protein
LIDVVPAPSARSAATTSCTGTRSRRPIGSEPSATRIATTEVPGVTSGVAWSASAATNEPATTRTFA